MFNFSAYSTSVYPSFYWIVFTFTRFLIKLVEDRLGKLNTVKLSTALTIIFLVLLLSVRSLIFFVLLAAAMAPGFPLMQKYTAQKLPPREVGLFNGMIFAFTSIGNVIIAGSMGGIGDHNIKLSYLIPIFGAVLILMILFYLTKLKKAGLIKVSPK
jgi:fucose permease